MLAYYQYHLHIKWSFDYLIAINKLHNSKNGSDHCFCLEHLSAHAPLCHVYIYAFATYTIPVS